MRCLLTLCFLLFSLVTQAVSLRADYPKQYVVKPGDTLWSIANKYLDKPWEWKQLWHANPKIKNPNKLYAGAVIELDYNNKNPYLRVLSNGTIKLSPFMRPSRIENPIPAIPLSDIKPFLNASLIMDEDLLENAPYVVAFMGEHMLGGQGDELYVKNLCPNPNLAPGTTISYALYRPGCPYISPRTKEILGYKATLVGYGQLSRKGEPATILLTDITEGIKLKDRVLLNDAPEFNLFFEPKTPLHRVRGTIIELPPSYTQGAIGLIAVIDQGQNAGLEPGDVLGLYSPHRVVPDPKCCDKTIVLPRERVGEVMIFRTFSRTSFALVVRSTRAVHLMDFVTNP